MFIQFLHLVNDFCSCWPIVGQYIGTYICKESVSMSKRWKNRLLDDLWKNHSIKIWMMTKIYSCLMFIFVGSELTKTLVSLYSIRIMQIV